MRDFLTTSMMFQKTAFKAVASMTEAMLDMQMRFLRQQGALFDHLHATRRRDDFHATSVNLKTKKRKGSKKSTPCHGPDLLDHYGKRAHDVDVEHDI